MKQFDLTHYLDSIHTRLDVISTLEPELLPLLHFLLYDPLFLSSLHELESSLKYSNLSYDDALATPDGEDPGAMADLCFASASEYLSDSLKILRAKFMKRSLGG